MRKGTGASLSLRARLLLKLLRRRRLEPLAMARYARKHTRFYAEAYRDWDGATFEDLPLLTKQTARGISPYDLLARPLADRVFLYAETTGSAGSPTPSFFTRKEFHASTLLTYVTPYYALLKGALARNRTCVNGLAFGFTVAGMSFGDLLGNIGGLVANVGSRSTLATPERIARCIARLKPSVITGTPGDFLAWMRIVREDHSAAYPEVVDRLQVLLSTAELCSASRARRIAEHFSITHIDTYACVEGMFALSCPCGEKHILPAYHAEVISEGGALLGTTGTGRFAFTNLLKRSTPMVRYLLDDWITLYRSECPYGFDLSIVPHGRYELTVPVQSGRIGLRHMEEAIFEQDLFGAYTLEIEEKGARLTVERYEGEPDTTRVRSSLAALLEMPVEIDLVDYGALDDPRAVRASKPILRLKDRRPTSQQTIPSHL